MKKINITIKKLANNVHIISSYTKFIFFYKFIIILLILLFLFYSLYFSIKYNSSNSINKNNKNLSNLKLPIRLAYYCNSIKYGGVERIIALLINKLSWTKLFKQYLITKSKILEEEYIIPNDTIRFSLIDLNMNIFDILKKEKIDILVYNLYRKEEMFKLTQLKRTKTIFYDHSSIFFWIYQKRYRFKNSFYSIYKRCKYVISLIPFENNYLFKKWGINSILMDNLNTYEYDSVFPSKLIESNIIMVGRGEDEYKRFDLGIKAMEYIVKEIPNCSMNIISIPTSKLIKLVDFLRLNENIKFIGFIKDPAIYYQNSSLHIMPSLTEAFPMVLSEAKIYGIPSIICGLDYLVLAKGGTVILYDDKPNIIAKEAIKILKNDSYRRKLGKEARESMKKRKNKYIVKKWIKMLVTVFYGEQYYNDKSEKISQNEINIILNNQLNLMKKRIPIFRAKSLEKLKSILLNSYYK